MALSLRVIPGYQFGETERIDQVKLNQLGRPTIELQGAIASSAILPGSITAEKLNPFLISDLTRKDPPEGSDLLMIQDAAGLRSTTISDLLELSAPTLETISTVNLGDYAWIIQSGDNKQATIADTLRKAIHDQTALATPLEIDPLKDEILLYDFNAPSGSNQNRKATVQTAVWSVTNTLIADAPAFTGTIDRVNDELLIRRVAGTAGAQQAKIKLSDVLAQAGGIKAWVSFNGRNQTTMVRITFHPNTQTVTTQELDDPRGPMQTRLKAGEFVWFHDAVPTPGVDDLKPYFVHPVNSTTLEFYYTSAGAINRDQAQRVPIVVNDGSDEHYFWMWSKASGAPVIRGQMNVSSVVRSGGSGNDRKDLGSYRIHFEKPLLSAAYATLVTGSEGPHAGDGRNEGLLGALDYSYTVPTVDYFDVTTYDHDGLADAAYVSVVVVG